MDQKNATPTLAAAIAGMKRKEKKTDRPFQDASELRLLGLEDKFQARIEWKQETGRSFAREEVSTFDSVRDELARRDDSSIQDARLEFASRNKFWSYFPDAGPLRRELYPRHLEVIGHTRTDDEVLFCAANKVGKTIVGAYCVTAWATGRYPKWWHGRKFDGANTFWICNKSAKDVRDINEAELFGPPGDLEARGTAMIPSHLIDHVTPKAGVPNGLEFGYVEHVSGALATIVSKSYDQGRTAFQGRNIPGIWNDEEVPKDVYEEECLRIMVVNGVIINTYTPILGLTEMTQWFIEAAGFSIESLRRERADTAVLEI